MSGQVMPGRSQHSSWVEQLMCRGGLLGGYDIEASRHKDDALPT